MCGHFFSSAKSCAVWTTGGHCPPIRNNMNFITAFSILFGCCRILTVPDAADTIFVSTKEREGTMANHICISGTMSPLSFSHEVFGERFFAAKLSVERQSGTCDVVPIIVSERLIDVTKDYSEDHVRIHGQIRSYNKHNAQTINLILSVFTTDFEIIDNDVFDENVVTIDGYICRPPTYRETPFGRQISDVMLAVNRQYSKSDYIPCVFWGRNAVFASCCDVGAHLCIAGRFQSREYFKQKGNGSGEWRTAYEVSVLTLTEG